MMLCLFLLVVSLSCVLGEILELPSNLPCKVDDVKCITEVTDWIVKATMLGVPEKGIPKLDPIDHETIEGSLGYVKYKLTKAHVEGLKSCKITRASVNSNATTMHMELLCRQNHMDGQYDIEGKLLSYPINGKGIFNVDTTNYLCVFDTNMAFYKRKSSLYVKHENYTFTCELLGELDIDLRTLDGKKKTSEIVVNMTEFAKKNAKLFSSLVDNPIHDDNIRKFVKNINKYLGLIPVTDMLILNKLNVA